MVATEITGPVSAPRLFPGATVAILAPGPSLTREDLDYVRGKVPTIAINDAVLKAPWADVFYTSAEAWLKGHGWIETFQGHKFMVTLEREAKRDASHPEFLVLGNTGQTGLELSPDALRVGHNSGYAALNLASHFGASKILLLGYNMGPGHYTGYLSYFESLVDPLKSAGVDVVNCTPNTFLKCFPCRPLRDVLSV